MTSKGRLTRDEMISVWWTCGVRVEVNRRKMLAVLGGASMALSGSATGAEQQSSNCVSKGADVPRTVREKPNPLEIVWDNFQREKYTKYVEMKVRNNRSSDYMTASCTVHFYDTNEQKITDDGQSLMGFEAHDVWLFKVPVDAMVEVGRYEIELSAV